MLWCGHRYGGRLTERQAVNLVLQPFLSALLYLHTQVCGFYKPNDTWCFALNSDACILIGRRFCAG